MKSNFNGIIRECNWFVGFEKDRIKMKLLLDTLDLEQIRKFSKLGILSGVTTNPTFSKKVWYER